MGTEQVTFVVRNENSKNPPPFLSFCFQSFNFVICTYSLFFNRVIYVILSICVEGCHVSSECRYEMVFLILRR